MMVLVRFGLSYWMLLYQEVMSILPTHDGTGSLRAFVLDMEEEAIYLTLRPLAPSVDWKTPAQKLPIGYAGGYAQIYGIALG
jgi:hypothetical protein